MHYSPIQNFYSVHAQITSRKGREWFQPEINLPADMDLDDVAREVLDLLASNYITVTGFRIFDLTSMRDVTSDALRVAAEKALEKWPEDHLHPVLEDEADDLARAHFDNIAAEEAHIRHERAALRHSF